MKIGLFRRFTPEDFKEEEDLPSWLEQLFQMLNNVLEEHTDAFQRGLTFGDNFRSEIRTFEIQNNTSTPIELQLLKRNPTGAFLIKSSYYNPAQWAWQPSEGDSLTVDVTVKWDTAPSENPTVTFLFIGE